MNKKRAIIKNGKIIYDEESSLQKSNEFSAKHNREAMKVKYRKDLVQPNEIAFGKAWPEKAKELYGDETMRLIG